MVELGLLAFKLDTARRVSITTAPSSFPEQRLRYRLLYLLHRLRSLPGAGNLQSEAPTKASRFGGRVC